MSSDALMESIEAGANPPHDVLESPERDNIIDAALLSRSGRAWLRRYPLLDAPLADRLIAREADLRLERRDASLSWVVERASLDAVLQHATAIAGGPAAAALWRRLDGDGEALEERAMSIVGSGDGAAAQATLVHLVMDPMNPHGLDDERRGRIARAALGSPEAGIRGMAAEHMLAHDPAELLTSFDDRVRDPSERVRGVTWLAALQLARDDARDKAFHVILNDEEELEIRRSALIAVGTRLPTSDLVEMLSLLVTHPVEPLARDAAELLFREHRHPIVAEAALRSPHQQVREIAEKLLDPLRGSPAAGGSRPGDTAQIFSDMMRQIEQRADDPDCKGSGGS
ncbi:MAG TPA: hypothetical protein VMM78_07175 [Thermomicrobiales bacterium]|nr:hypothetical protein [Thermomicrobiales bacterium]